ncbi:MAG: EamA family transporter [Chloroflexi bacterium]|nr:EamA family transporter [Chloroflexota bacterium]
MSRRSGRFGDALIGYLLIWLAAVLWASLALFYKAVLGLGVPPLTLVAYRAGGAACALAIWMVIRGDFPAGLRISRRDGPLMLAYGVVGVALFYIAYAYAIHLTGIAMAVVLMYTAPAWVALIAWRWLGEGMDLRRGIALVLAFLGCALVAQAYDVTALRFNVLGVLWGLGAGIGYGLYSIFNKLAVRRYSPAVVQFYGFAIGAFLLVALQPPRDLLAPLRSLPVLGLLIFIAVGPTLGGGLAYAAGVQRIRVSVASLLATLEPALAVLMGYLGFGEVLDPPQWIGVGLVLIAAVLLRPREAPADVMAPARGG